MRKAFITVSKIAFYWGFLQIILIGGAYFGVFSAEVHQGSGFVMEGLFLALVVLAILGKMGGPIIGFSILGLAMLTPISTLLLSVGNPAILRALHPIFGIGAMFMGKSLAERAEKLS